MIALDDQKTWVRAEDITVVRLNSYGQDYWRVLVHLRDGKIVEGRDMREGHAREKVADILKELR